MKSIFITGASSGLGEALAREFSNEGVTLGLLARRLERLDLLASDLSGTVCNFSADVGDPLAMRAVAENFIRSVGVPDVVIANAGISVGTMTSSVADQEVFERIMRTNVLGIVNTFQPFIDAMEKRGSGTLVGISSIAGFRGMPGSGAYSASKSAVNVYLESLRVELSSSGVRVLTICPGYIKTAMTDVNPFYMPFLMKPEAAAHSIKKAIDKNKRFHVMPWQMRIVAYFLRVLPRVVYDQLLKRAPRKPRSI